MKIYSWNMYFINTELERALAFIRELDFDVLCLQEVPEEFLSLLRTLSLYMTEAVELDYVYKAKACRRFSVILSPHELTNANAFKLPNRSRLPLSGAIFSRVLQTSGIWIKMINIEKERHGVLAEVTCNGKVLRIISVHLSLTNPRWRKEELAITLAHVASDIPTVVCGDFNTLESAHVTMLNYVLGGNFSDTKPHKEREDVEKLFATQHLLNPLRGHVTHPLSRSQLDHLLVSDTLTITDVGVLRERVGSDHNPVFVQVS